MELVLLVPPVVPMEHALVGNRTTLSPLAKLSKQGMTSTAMRDHCNGIVPLLGCLCGQSDYVVRDDALESQIQILAAG